MSSSDVLIELQDVTKVFDDQAALSHLNLSIQNGEFLTFLGPSGCGKTTVLRLIAGFETPTHGIIRINGQTVNELPPNKRGVNTVFQSYALFPHMTVFDNVAFGLKLKGLPQSEIKSMVSEALQMVKLNGFEDRKPVQLSGGQQQRVAVARAVVNKPLVLLLDEPLSALDYKLRKEMQVELKHLHRKLGITFVFVTHDQEEAFTMSDRVVVMNQGAIEQIGTPREVYEEPDNLFVARFVGEINMLAGTVQTQNGRFVEALVEGSVCKLVSKRSFTAGQKVKVLLRPEDMWIWQKGQRPAFGDKGAAAFSFFGRIEDTIYKGTTLDLIIAMDSGQRIQATEFFNEDDEAWNFKVGDQVEISWVEGWEVVLPDA